MSESFLASEAAGWTDAVLQSGDPATCFSSVSIDTRTIGEGALFVAIKGPSFDAHDFLDQAIDKGAEGILVQRDCDVSKCRRFGDGDKEIAVLEVEDTERALGALAAGHRARFRGPLVAITGSSGKTTTKELCAAVLSEWAPCLKTQGNLNNQYGLPLTLLRRERRHEVAVVELGMNHRGEIAALAAITAPTVGLVTNAGTAHIEFLGTREEIAQEKGDLFAALPEDGIAVVNCDDLQVASQAKRAPCRQILYGLSPDAEVTALNVRFEPPGSYHFDVRETHDTRDAGAPAEPFAVEIAGLAETTVINGLAAAAVGLAVGASPAQIASGLARYRPEAGRMAPRTLANEVTLIDDSYNANPQSMRAALETLAKLSGGRSIAVLGDMGELGESAAAEHAAVGRAAAELGIDWLFWLGEAANTALAAAREAGMDASRVGSAKTQLELAHRVRDVLAPRDWILVKGSRAMRMEQVIDELASEGAR
jgi:UDP-N-acetylmuramoyl-tripeptide--D-alanyl-D-alanine ligase